MEKSGKNALEELSWGRRRERGQREIGKSKNRSGESIAWRGLGCMCTRVSCADGAFHVNYT